jgi:hypothetical protein
MINAVTKETHQPNNEERLYDWAVREIYHHADLVHAKVRTRPGIEGRTIFDLDYTEVPGAEATILSVHEPVWFAKSLHKARKQLADDLAVVSITA